MKLSRITAGIFLSVAITAGGIVSAGPAAALGTPRPTPVPCHFPDQCPAQPPLGCVFRAGYYANHPGTVFVNPDRTSIMVRRPLIYIRILLNMSWQEILDTPSGGDLELKAAKQMIAAAMNIHYNYNTPPLSAAAGEAYTAFHNYFETGGARALTPRQMRRHTAALKAFNTGKDTLPAC